MTFPTSYIQDIPIPASLPWLTSSSSHGNTEMSGNERAARKMSSRFTDSLLVVKCHHEWDMEQDRCSTRQKRHLLRESKPTWTNCLQVTPSVRPHFLGKGTVFYRQRIYILQEPGFSAQYFQFGAVLCPAKSVSSQPDSLLNALAHQPSREGLAEAVFKPVPTWGGCGSSESFCTVISGQVFNTGLLTSGGLCEWKLGHCQAAWKDGFPWSDVWFQVSLPPTPLPLPHLLPSALQSLRRLYARLCRRETHKCKHRLSPPPLLAFEKVVWWLLTKGLP